MQHKKDATTKKLLKQTKQTPKSVIYFHLYFYIFILFYFSVSTLILPNPPTQQPSPEAHTAQHQKNPFQVPFFVHTKKKLSSPSFCRFFQRTLFCAIFVCSGKMTRKYSRVCSLHHTVSVSTVSSKIIYPKTYSYRDNLLQQKFYKLFQQRLIIY